MGKRERDERRLSQVSLLSLEEARIFKLDPQTVMIGLGTLLNNRCLRMVNNIGSDEPTEEEKWIKRNLECVASFIAPDNRELWLGLGAYRKVVIKTLRYMRFFGFSDEELSARGISSTVERIPGEMGFKDEKWEEETGLIDLRSRALTKALVIIREQAGYDPANVQMQRELVEEEVQGETIAQCLEVNLDERDREILEILDVLMEDHGRDAPYEKFLRWAKEKNPSLYFPSEG